MYTQLFIFVTLASLSGFLFGCKRDNKQVTTEDTLPQELIDRGNLYCELSKAAYQEKGYVHSKCDGAGFTSLYAVRCGMVDLSVFEDSATGKPYRSPTHDCYSTGASKSEFSRDMLLMRMVAAWVHKDLAWLKRFINFASKNDWVMCQAVDDATRIGRCVVSPQLINLLYDMETLLEKSQATALRRSSDDAVEIKADFEAHLDVLRIWLEGEVYGAITDAQLTRLEKYADRETKNALYLAVAAKYGYGDMASARYVLHEQFPHDRLPTSSDWDTGYLYQRDMLKNGVTNPDWLPSDKNEVHSGTDFNFALYVMGGK